MRTIETTARVSEDGTLTVRVPPDVAPGEHRIVVVIDEELANGATSGDLGSVEHEGATTVTPTDAERERRFIEGWPVHHVGQWPEGLSLRREDMYDDWGR